jgi:hypothetical protein
LAAALVAVAACGGNARPTGDIPPTLKAIGGPETVLLRFPRDGGLPRSYRWPSLDTAIWTGAERVPAIGRLLAFDDGGGMVALVTADGRAGRIDLRSGRLQLTAKPLTHAASADGWSVYGIDPDGRIERTTPTAEWKGAVMSADTVFALQGGGIVLVTNDGDQTRLVRFHPPSVKPMDTLKLPHVDALVRTLNGDRVYARTTRGVVAIDARTWHVVPGPRSSHRAAAIAPTPSGDRALVLDADGKTIRVWDRYAEEFGNTIALPRPAADLRMDPLGRYVLARMADHDSALVISVPMERVVSVIATEWRHDLPAVAPNGAILTLRRTDVVAVDPVTGVRRMRVTDGAADVWMVVRWDGFRPRDSTLDAPATFATETPADSAAAADAIDSLLAVHAGDAARISLDSIANASSGATARGSATGNARGRAGRRMTIDTVTGAVFTLQFAAMLSETSARDVARKIRVYGRQPRVVVGTHDGVKTYRVVLGPYRTRELADAAGKRSGVPYIIVSGLP